METAGRGSRAPCLRERMASPVVPSCCHKRFHTVSLQGWPNPRGARGEDWLAACKGIGSRRHGAPFVIVRRKQLKAHFARQIRAKSCQVLSAVAPVSFIFCHSSPHACIRARDAGGKFRGSGGGSRCGVGASIGAAEIAGAEGKSIVARPPSGPAGRAGGSGTMNDGFGFAAASSANAGRRAS